MRLAKGIMELKFHPCLQYASQMRFSSMSACTASMSIASSVSTACHSLHRASLQAVRLAAVKHAVLEHQLLKQALLKQTC